MIIAYIGRFFRDNEFSTATNIKILSILLNIFNIDIKNINKHIDII